MLDTDDIRRARLSAPITEDEKREALARCAAAIDAIDTPRHVTADLVTAVDTLLSALPGLVEHADDLASIPGVGPEVLEECRDAGLAALAVYDATRAAADEAKAEKQHLLEEAKDVLRRLDDQAWALGRPGGVPGMRSFTLGRGHAELAANLEAHVALFREHWLEVRGITSVTEQLLERAMGLAGELDHLLGPDAHARLDLLGRRRAQAYTLVVERWRGLQLALACVRRETGDAKTLAPTLFVRRRRRRGVSAGEIRTAALEP